MGLSRTPEEILATVFCLTDLVLTGLMRESKFDAVDDHDTCDVSAVKFDDGRMWQRL